MQLNKKEKRNLLLILIKLNLTNIDQVAKLDCSNSCKAFWGLSVMLSEEKMLNTKYTNFGKLSLSMHFALLVTMM